MVAVCEWSLGQVSLYAYFVPLSLVYPLLSTYVPVHHVHVYTCAPSPLALHQVYTCTSCCVFM